MSEGSIPPFRLRSFPGSVLKQALGRLFKNRPYEAPAPKREPKAATTSPLVALAGETIREHAEDQSALFERAFRLEERSDRLKREGTPSESADNRAERAKEEAKDSLSRLRSSFDKDKGPEGRTAFDRELERRFPGFRLSGSSYRR